MTEQQDIISSIGLFPFYAAFFCTDGIWERLTDKVKLGHAFMIMQLLAIKYPEYVQVLNRSHNVHVIDALHNAFKHNGRQPGWSYTKVVHNKTATETGKYPKWLIDQFMKSNGLEQKSFDFLVQIEPELIIPLLDEEMVKINMAVKPKKK